VNKQLNIKNKIKEYFLFQKKCMPFYYQTLNYGAKFSVSEIRHLTILAFDMSTLPFSYR